MDLLHEQSEAAVGRYSADLVFRQNGTGRCVVVENMLGSTDHDHLGKLITYAAGLEAGYAVLIAPDFRDEHRSALNWLNRISNDDFGFFGVVLEAWRKGDSLPAPRLRVEASIDTGEKETTKEVFDALQGRKQQIEQAVGEELEWDRLDDKRASRISLYFPDDIQISNEDRWPQAQSWLVQTMGKMRDAFDPVLKEL